MFQTVNYKKSDWIICYFVLFARKKKTNLWSLS